MRLILTPARSTWRWLGSQVIRLRPKIAHNEWVIGLAFTVGMASLSAALGVLPDQGRGGWPHSTAKLTYLVTFTTLGVALVVAGAYMWWWYNKIRRQRGTAFIIDETGSGWDHVNAHTFLSRLDTQFAAVRPVAGPAVLDNWHWPTDHDLDQWDRRVNDLVRAVRVLCADDAKDIDKTLYIWALWPVAIAMTARITTQERGLPLYIGQRPSFGRAGTVLPEPSDPTGHPFHTVTAPPAGLIEEFTHPIRLRVAGAKPTRTSQRVLILLIRGLDQPWSTIGTTPSSSRVDFPLHDGAGLKLTSTDTDVHEWRYRPTKEHIAWTDYPAIVNAAAEWIHAQTTTRPETLILLGSVMPQEVNAGLGVCIARNPTGWPTNIWPIVVPRTHNTVRDPVTPPLNLGTSSLTGSAH